MNNQLFKYLFIFFLSIKSNSYNEIQRLILTIAHIKIPQNIFVSSTHNSNLENWVFEDLKSILETKKYLKFIEFKKTYEELYITILDPKLLIVKFRLLKSKLKKTCTAILCYKEIFIELMTIVENIIQKFEGLINVKNKNSELSNFDLLVCLITKSNEDFFNFNCKNILNVLINTKNALQEILTLYSESLKIFFWFKCAVWNKSSTLIKEIISNEKNMEFDFPFTLQLNHINETFKLAFSNLKYLLKNTNNSHRTLKLLLINSFLKTLESQKVRIMFENSIFKNQFQISAEQIENSFKNFIFRVKIEVKEMFYEIKYLENLINGIVEYPERLNGILIALNDMSFKAIKAKLLEYENIRATILKNRSSNFSKMELHLYKLKMKVNKASADSIKPEIKLNENISIDEVFNYFKREKQIVFGQLKSFEKIFYPHKFAIVTFVDAYICCLNDISISIKKKLVELPVTQFYMREYYINVLKCIHECKMKSKNELKCILIPDLNEKGEFGDSNWYDPIVNYYLGFIDFINNN